MQTESPTPTQFLDIPLASLHESTWNPRKHYDDAKLHELADSIRGKGVIEPIVVRANAQGYEILAGSRRFRASKLAGLASIPAVVRVIDDTAALELAVIENGQREDIHPLDEAEGYRALMQADPHYTVAVVAAKVGKSESYVYRRLRLLDLEAPLLKAMAEDRLPVAYAEKLLRLTPALRQEAADPESGVVWFTRPLFDGEEDDALPGRDDLRPLHDLERFIRERSSFSPASEDARHFQPDLAEQLDALIEEEFTDTTDTPENIAALTASLVELSADPMARMRMRADKHATIPLTPSKWREIKTPKDRCEFARRGVITHGGPTRILEVCTKRSCAKHFPPAKKAKPSKAAAQPKGESNQDRWAREDAERERKAKEWKAVLAVAAPAFAKATASVKCSAALVREVLSGHAIEKVKTVFGVAFTDATAAHVMLLSSIDTWDRSQFLRSVKRHKFNLGPIEQQLKADAKKAEQAAAKASAKASTPAKKAAAKGRK